MDELVSNRMARLVADWQQRGDKRAIFLQCYQMMTANMETAVADGRFHDALWVTHLLTHFANYYFRALDAYDAAKPCAAVWQMTHAAAAQRKTKVLQNLFLGVNAHINYDLALTVYDLLHPEWPTLSAAGRHLRYQDYCLVNAIIAETINAVQDEVVERYAPLLALVDWLGGPVDEFIIEQLISHWREEVWRYALQLLAAPDDAARESMRQVVETTALRRAHTILGL